MKLRIVPLLCGGLRTVSIAVLVFAGTISIASAQYGPEDYPPGFLDRLSGQGAANAAKAEIDEITNAATDAAYKDNCIRLSVLRSRLNDINNNGNHPFWERHGMVRISIAEPAMRSARDSTQALLADRIEFLNALRCPRPATAKTEGGGQLISLPNSIFFLSEDSFRSRSATAAGVTVEVAGSAIARRVTGNVQRIARDFGGMIFYDLGNENQNGSGAGLNVGARVPINTSFFGYKSYLNFAYNFLNVQGDGSGGQATTPTFILFPGLGVGTTPNGFFAGGTPFSYQYNFTQQRHGGEIAAGFEIERGPVEFYPWAGVRFGSNSVDDSYTVNRPAPVPIVATYTTDSNVTSLGPFIGLSVSFQPQGSPIELFTQGRVGIDSNWARSDVNFNIVFPGTNETQQVSLSQQKFTPYLFLETGVKVKLGVVQANVSGFVEHGGYAPSISIPGGGASPVLQGETETNYGGKFSLTARFN